MSTQQRQLKSRQTWIEIYQKTGSVSITSRRCGVPRSTLYRWIQRYKSGGTAELHDRSRRPKNLARQKVTTELKELVCSIRASHHFGPQSISTHLLRVHSISLSPATVWRILKKEGIPLIKRYRKPDKKLRYSKAIPGERVQMDVMKVSPKCYQFTAVDDCTRLRALRLYPNKKAESSIDFLSYLIDTFMFPIHRIQTDWGPEFFNDAFQEELMVHFIKYRPIRPRSPHLNGKVERSQLTDKVEFYSTIPKDERNIDLQEKLLDWQNFYNHQRPHSSLKGKTPYERYLELEPLIPIQPDVTAEYWKQEHEIRPRNSAWQYRKK